MTTGNCHSTEDDEDWKRTAEDVAGSLAALTAGRLSLPNPGSAELRAGTSGGRCAGRQDGAARSPQRALRACPRPGPLGPARPRLPGRGSARTHTLSPRSPQQKSLLTLISRKATSSPLFPSQFGTGAFAPPHSAALRGVEVPPPLWRSGARLREPGGRQHPGPQGGWDRLRRPPGVWEPRPRGARVSRCGAAAISLEWVGNRKQLRQVYTSTGLTRRLALQA